MRIDRRVAERPRCGSCCCRTTVFVDCSAVQFLPRVLKPVLSFLRQSSCYSHSLSLQFLFRRTHSHIQQQLFDHSRFTKMYALRALLVTAMTATVAMAFALPGGSSSGSNPPENANSPSCGGDQAVCCTGSYTAEGELVDNCITCMWKALPVLDLNLRLTCAIDTAQNSVCQTNSNVYCCYTCAEAVSHFISMLTIYHFCTEANCRIGWQLCWMRALLLRADVFRPISETALLDHRGMLGISIIFHLFVRRKPISCMIIGFGVSSLLLEKTIIIHSNIKLYFLI